MDGEMDAVAVTRETYDASTEVYARNRADRSALVAPLDAFAKTVPRDGVVIDLGCGPGMETQSLRERGIRVVGVDLSRGMLALAQATHGGAFVQGNALALPLADACVTGVWACASLLHLPRPLMPTAMAECHRVMVAGGAFHLHLKRGSAEEFQKTDLNGQRWFTYWKDEPLDALIEETGFEVVGGERNREPWMYRLCRKR